MKKTGTGLLWSIPEMWEVGKNCHLEKITCTHCGSVETACVLHTHGEPLRSHLCQGCGGHIGASRWQLADTSETRDTSGEAAPPAGCWVCAESRERSEWQNAEGCATCAVEQPPPVQGTLF